MDSEAYHRSCYNLEKAAFSTTKLGVICIFVARWLCLEHSLVQILGASSKLSMAQIWRKQKIGLRYLLSRIICPQSTVSPKMGSKRSHGGRGYLGHTLWTTNPRFLTSSNPTKPQKCPELYVQELLHVDCTVNSSIYVIPNSQIFNPVFLKG